jgi:hypothetical protein
LLTAEALLCAESNVVIAKTDPLSKRSLQQCQDLFPQPSSLSIHSRMDAGQFSSFTPSASQPLRAHNVGSEPRVLAESPDSGRLGVIVHSVVWARRTSLKKIRDLFVANGDPMVSRKFTHNPLAAKAAETTILFPSKWPSRSVVEGGVVYVGHASLYPQRKPSASLEVAGKYRTGQSVFGIIRNAKCFRFSTDLNDRSNGTESFVLRDGHAVLYVGKDVWW